MNIIEFDRWKPSTDNPRKLEYAGQRTDQEVFEELKHRLEGMGCLPDEYFDLRSDWENGREIPKEADLFYRRVEQVKTSDIDFLSRLCHNAGISLKITDNMLVLFDQKDYEGKGTVFTIKRGKAGKYVKYKLGAGAADTQYGSCRVSYTDPGSGKCIEGTYTASGEDAKSGQCLEITARVTDAGEAKTLAEKSLRLHNKFTRTASFTLPGNPALVAGATVMLEDWGGWDGKYIIKQAKHTVDSSGGYTTQIALRRVLEGY